MAKRPLLVYAFTARHLLIAGAVFVALVICLAVWGGAGSQYRFFPFGWGKPGGTGTPSSPGSPPGPSGSPSGSDLRGLPGSPDATSPADPTDPSDPHLPLENVLIVLDPGHGGEDRGVCHFPDDLIEKEINLDVALRLKGELEKAGARVLLTRDEDTFVSLDERAKVANDAQADVFLSLHVNRIPGHPDCFGAQTFFFPGSEEGKRFAQFLQEELLKIDPENYRSPLAGAYRVLRLTTMPGALVEIGFMTNARDRQLIAGEEYRDQVSVAITRGVIRFLSDDRRGDSPPPAGR